jgi:hypothetical protein
MAATKVRFVLLLATTLLILSGAPIRTQEVESTEDEEVFIYKGADLPLIFVVQSFFEAIASVAREGDDVLEDFLHERMGIAPKSTAYDAILKASLAAGPWLAMETINPTLTGDAYGEFQHKAINQQAYGLRDVFAELISDLEASGYGRERFREVMDREFRSGTGVTAIGGPLEPFFSDAIAAFEILNF